MAERFTPSAAQPPRKNLSQRAPRTGDERAPKAARNRPSIPPASPDSQYTREAWDDECYAVFGEGRDPAPCPRCGHTGFYGPRIEEPERRFRQCRFCGFTQEVGKPSESYRPSVHGCDDWPEAGRAPYIWWVPLGVASYTCPFCRGLVTVSKTLTTAPIDDSNHPWRKVPQHRDRLYYLRFWENWPVTKGRAFL